MSKNHDHSLTQDWRVPRIEARQTDALVIRDTLEHLDDLTELFDYERDEEVTAAIRELKGLLKERASDREQEAEILDAAVKTKAQEVGSAA